MRILSARTSEWAATTAPPPSRLLVTFLVLIIGIIISIDEVRGQLRLVSGPNQAIPKPFQDDILPMCYRTGDVIDGLGRILKLNTYLSPKSTSSMLSRFSIYNKHKHMEGIRFFPKINCTLGIFNKTFGPYQYDLDLLLQSGFNHRTRTVILVPGYRSKLQEDWIVGARKDWLELDEEADVIEVSWSDSNKGIYSEAVAHTPLVGRQITLLLYYLAELSGIDVYDEQFLGNIHLVGHSLGAHIAGFVGQDLGHGVGRITGLDPAGPSFDQFTDAQRLSKTDAKFVDIIHTNRGKMRYVNLVASASLQAIGRLPGMDNLAKSIGSSYSGEGDTAWYGIDLPLGHVDYYANNGRVQPGCDDFLHICDHNRATDIYTDIIRHERLLRRGLTIEYSQDSSKANVSMVADTMKSSRLLAFQANSYEDFMSGENLVQNCRQLVDVDVHLSGQLIGGAMNDCLMPIDLISHVDKVRAQLKRDHPNLVVDLDSTLRPQVERKFYFKTLDASPLIGDHYLMKIYFSSAPVWQEESCSMEAKLEMYDNKTVSIELDKLADSIGPQVPLAVPFIHPDGVEARPKLIKLFNELSLPRTGSGGGGNGSGGQPHEVVVEDVVAANEALVRWLLPRSIKLSMGKPKSKSVFGVVKDLTRKMIKMDGELSCNFMIDAIEVHPISLMMDEQAKNFAGLYNRRSSGDNNDDDDQQGNSDSDKKQKHLKVVKVSEFNQLRSDQVIAKMEPGFQMSIEVNLDSIVLND